MWNTMRLVSALALLALFCTIISTNAQIIGPVYPYAYKCLENKCVKVFREGTAEETSFSKCKLNCGSAGSLWPIPTGTVSLSPGFSNFRGPYEIIPVISTGIDPTLKLWLEEAFVVFKGYLNKMVPTPVSSSFGSNSEINAPLLTRVTLNVTSTSLELGLKTDESYKLQIETKPDDEITVTITAATYFGARHGLETLSQLIAYEQPEGTNHVYAIVASATIEDAPVYKYRGLMLDTSRNYASVAAIRNLINGLSFNKLNIFHWHITDTHSFPMEVTNNVNMSRYGAYSPSKVYTVAEMKDIVTYAKKRGVKIIAEFDAPAHTGNGWIWSADEVPDSPESLAVCVNKDPWYDFCVEPPCGQLNIANDRMFEVLSQIYESMMGIFDNDVFHMGGDEVDLRCYNTTKVITDFMATNDWPRNRDGFMELWNYFQTRAYEEWTNATIDSENPIPDPDRLAILWTSELTSQEYITKYLEQDKYAVQIWTNGDDPIVPFLIQNKYRVIFSNVNAWYLDCGFHNWIGTDGHNWCSPYKTWQNVYSNSPYKNVLASTDKDTADAALRDGLILGGVAPLWTESADERSIEGRFWPRGSALAERLWSDPQNTGPAEAVTRILQNRQRYVERGIAADRIQPEWCLQNEDKCKDERFTPPVTTTTTTTTTAPPAKESAVSIQLTLAVLLIEAIVLLL